MPDYKHLRLLLEKKQAVLVHNTTYWQRPRRRVLAAPTIPREVISVRNYSFDPSRFRNLQIPVLLLLGSESHPVYKAATETLHAALPHSRPVVLPRQHHDAVVTAPHLVLREIIRFFLGPV